MVLIDVSPHLLAGFSTHIRPMREPPIFVFDGVCVLCSSAVQYVLKHEKTQDMRFVSIQSDQGRDFAIANGIDPQNPKSFLLIKDGQVLQSSSGALAVLKYAGGPLSWLRVLWIIPRPIRDWAYLVIARNRYRLFGKTNVCMVPDPEKRDRFVLP